MLPLIWLWCNIFETMPFAATYVAVFVKALFARKIFQMAQFMRKIFQTAQEPAFCRHLCGCFPKTARSAENFSTGALRAPGLMSIESC